MFMKNRLQYLFLLPAYAGLLAMPLAANAQFTYTTTSGTITITGDTNIPVNGVVVIPDTINGLPVVEIGAYAFDGANLTSVTIPDSVITIDNFGFGGCAYLANVTIGNKVTGINSFAFSDCSSLTSVTIPDSVTYIALFAFENCHSLTNVIIGNSVNNVGQACFGGDTSLKSVTFGTSFASIQYTAFEDCTSLTSLYFKGNAPVYGSDVFYEANTPTVYYLPGTTGWGTNFDGLTTAQWILFSYGTNIAGITITGYTGWGGAAIIPGTINGLPVTQIGGAAFDGANVTSVTIPNSVTNIGDFAFENCHSLTNMIIPNSVINAGNYTFYNCDDLTSVTLPTNITYIGEAMFEVCDRLTSINIPAGVIGIGYYAFFGCMSLTNVAIPASTTSIQPWAFAICNDLTRFTVATNNAYFSSVNGVLFDKSQTTLIQAPPKGITGSYLVPNGVTSIGDFAFVSCVNLTNVTIPDSVTSIGYASFEACYSLTGVTLGNNVATIGDTAFCSCYALTSITIPNSVTSIGNSSFYGCFSLTNVTIGTSPPAIASSNGLGAKTQPSDQSPSQISIGTDAFGDCTSLKTITINAQNSAYSSVSGVLFDKNQDTLLQCPGGMAGTYSIPATATSIADYAFDGCISLTSITVPNSVTNIGNGAFANCSSLTGIYFLGNPPSLVGSEVFSNAADATLYYVPGNANWSPTFAGQPTAVWPPRFQTSNAGAGVKTNQFGFNVSWFSGQIVVVEACTNLASPVWQPIRTNTLSADSTYISDAGYTNHPSRYYRLRMQ
jgi:hypothetical protein